MSVRRIEERKENWREKLKFFDYFLHFLPFSFLIQQIIGLKGDMEILLVILKYIHPIHYSQNLLYLLFLHIFLCIFYAEVQCLNYSLSYERFGKFVKQYRAVQLTTFQMESQIYLGQTTFNKLKTPTWRNNMFYIYCPDKIEEITA